jgi:hypothetical protein
MPNDYGGWGGLWDGRGINKDDAFEMAVNRVYGDLVRANDGAACDVWCALANVDWKHESGDTASYSFRAAGDLVAAIRGKGMYIDWYCCGDYPRVTSEFAQAMANEGWTYAMA